MDFPEAFSRHYVTYLTADRTTSWRDDEAYAAPFVGLGIVDNEKRRWRVKDVWEIKDTYSGLECGVFAFVEPVTGTDDILARLPDA
ncbi:hypothetical protein GCM10010401_06630 [Rarobacter faecitabidus]|uniref:Uncharacterized protein n=1 Tax=Rarobacter faecitabidus TaxID=13243 RepID=A0A542ZTJ7_RARFA|nr:hypothetical protein [Rarobacter faecitabidus]TQL63589.1 hypothetical protein FB461_0051 [Rarobacter faecitabidus]